MKAAQFQRLVEQLGELTGEQRVALAVALEGKGDAAGTAALAEGYSSY